MRRKLGAVRQKGRLLLASAVVVLGAGVGASLALGGSASAACGYGVPCKPQPCPLSLTPPVIHRGNFVLVRGHWCNRGAAADVSSASQPGVKLHSAAFAAKTVTAKLNYRTDAYKKSVKVGQKVKPGKYKVVATFQATKLNTKTLQVKK